LFQHKHHLFKEAFPYLTPYKESPSVIICQSLLFPSLPFQRIYFYLLFIICFLHQQSLSYFIIMCFRWLHWTHHYDSGFLQHYAILISQPLFSLFHPVSILSYLFRFLRVWTQLHAYKAGTLALEPCLQPVLLWLCRKWDLVNYLPGLASNLHPLHVSLSSTQDCRCETQHPAISIT
jgi:hypothetical protein